MLLGSLAEPLNPARDPFYLSGATTGQPDGWHWIPNGRRRPEYLGRNVVFAQRRLLELLRGH